MHIPDGFLDPKLSGGLLGAAAGVLGYCLVKVFQTVTALVPKRVLSAVGNRLGDVSLAGRRVLTRIGGERLQRMGAVAAWVFAAQAFNFPVASGTSGHLLGGIFAGVLLGPFAGAVVVSVVLWVQALFFADGGLLALGANVINMSLVGTLAGYYVYAWLRRRIPEPASIALASWFSVVGAALACAWEIGFSGTVGTADVVRAMFKVHALMGVAEAVFTLLLLRVFGREEPV